MEKSMAIKRTRRLIFKALSNPKYNIKKNYQLHRKVIVASRPYFKQFYKIIDRKLKVNGTASTIRIFSPKVKEDQSLDIIVFFHGGGWVTGNIDSYSRICGNMANVTKHTVISVDYRLAPEHPFPSGLEDCYYVVKLLSSKVKKEGKSRKIILAGDSAGGNLAAVVSLLARESGEFMPEKQILLYPSCNNDYSESSPFESVKLYGEDYILTRKRISDYLDLYIEDKEDLKSPLVAPLLAKDLSRQPKTLIITAEFDPLRDEGEAYGMRLEEAGNTVLVKRIPNALHGFLSLPKSSEIIEESYNYINEFLN